MINSKIRDHSFQYSSLVHIIHMLIVRETMVRLWTGRVYLYWLVLWILSEEFHNQSDTFLWQRHRHVHIRVKSDANLIALWAE